MLSRILALALVVALPTVAAAQDAEEGKNVFKKCRACHTIGEKAVNRVGPELNGVVGRKAGSIEGFNYSAAMKDSGITWDEASLSEFLAKPKDKVPGTKMVFAGLKDDTDRANLIAYLKSFNADGSEAK
ncbi:Cytochrome c2 [Candidatus Filomicrobium marinum]|uniref:Cytochrome c2 n=2 Tax=Filomicrobium TaxID=119044 RepID=A0A0D6JC27_9HYPH|nr:MULTISPECIES: cytochrome c family protein [Filomicrobium]MCV0370991.1 cytochrome c family protein [Filomicrobium sp.]CFX04164.1 Cytochrome c2 [Candidatus Filomicrobium marinum]CPR15986.1 Cytochrome c2 [Candidatus Filomicrobium marinum]SDP43327.1 cytochrome c [Filomicrobium insigne]